MNKTLLGGLLAAALAPAALGDIPRTADGRPDLSGNYDIATLTPLERPKEFGEKLYMTPEEADAVIAANKERIAKLEATKNDDPDRKAPPKGGDGVLDFGAGGVGGYNTFWVDRGTDGFLIDGKFRTSIIYDPPNGRFPALTDQGKIILGKRFADFRRPNTGTAWWLAEGDGSGPYDNPEDRTTSDRCLQGFGSTGGPPMLPVLYNNMKRIVQTPDTVMILVEMVHDARVIRLNGEHAPEDLRFWMGDSIGWWEGETLVVDTTNFNDNPGMYRATRDLHVVERFTRVDRDTLLYSFTVEDPNIWTEPWSGEFTWPASTDPVYEYACHEANYAMEGILKGARLLEKEAREAEEGP
jgi:hypothetical protein